MDQIEAAQEAAIAKRAEEFALSRVEIARVYLRAVGFLLASLHAKCYALCSCNLLDVPGALGTASHEVASNAFADSAC